MKTRSQRLRRRPSRALAASLTAIVLLAAAVAVIWISIIRISTGAWPDFVGTADDGIGSLSWNSPGMWAASIIATAVGLILLLAAIIPGKYNGMPLQGGSDGNDAASEVMLSSRGIVRLANAHVQRMDGVVASKAKTKGRRVRITVTTPLRKPGDLRQRVADSVGGRFQEAGLKPPPKISVVVRSRDD